MGGRKHELSPEEYIYGAMQLYCDVVNLFMIFLSLFGVMSRDWNGNGLPKMHLIWTVFRFCSNLIVLH